MASSYGTDQTIRVVNSKEQTMNSLATVFLLINAVMLLLLPARWAPLPLLVGACYMALGSGIEIGSFHLPIIRILIFAGIVRVMMRGERVSGGMNGLDGLMLVWSGWVLLSSVFHKDPSGAFKFGLGLVYNACGIYFLLRIFYQSFDDVVRLCRVTAVLLVPLAIEMFYENLWVHNVFSLMGGVSDIPAIREGRVRAQGPFAHPIIAGTIGAVCLPLIVPLWHRHRKVAVIGIGACMVMILASSSSGPIMSLIAAVGALLMWHYRYYMRLVRWLTVFGYVLLELVMTAPAYYIMARVDFVGGSSGYHRADLIRSGIDHLSEWWLGGTDYTRHWMVTGVSWSPDHADITNHYLQMGVIGGLPLMLLFIAIMAKGLSLVGRLVRTAELPQQSRFVCWALGASLFAHATTFLSVSYFDQSFVFIYLTLGAISSVWSGTARRKSRSLNGHLIPDRIALRKSNLRVTKEALINSSF
jgi:hypothetical protein